MKGGVPTAKAAKPALNVIATVMSLFTSPFVAAAGSGVAAGTFTTVGMGGRILHMTTKQLQRKYMKHAVDFGLTGNWNKAAASKFSAAINQHINSLGIKVIYGTYRNQPAIHYLNPSTGLNVISRLNGQFWSGWKITPEQLKHVLKHGNLQ